MPWVNGVWVHEPDWAAQEALSPFPFSPQPAAGSEQPPWMQRQGFFNDPNNSSGHIPEGYQPVHPDPYENGYVDPFEGENIFIDQHRRGEIRYGDEYQEPVPTQQQIDDHYDSLWEARTNAPSGDLAGPHSDPLQDIPFEEVEFDHPSWEADRGARGRTVDQFQEQQRQYGRERAFRQHANDYPSPGSDLNNPSDQGIERARADLTQRGWSVEEVNDITDRAYPGWRERMDQNKYQGDREFARQRQQQRELDANQQWIQKTDPTAVMIDEGPFMNGLNDILLGLPAGASGVGGAMGGMTPLLIGLGLLAASQKPAIGQTQGSKNPRERSISGPKYQEHRKKGTPGQEPLTLAKKSSQKVQTQKAKSEAKKTGSRESAEIDKRVKQAEQSRYRERDPMQYGPKTQKAIKDKQKGKQTSMNQQPPWINAIMNIAAGNFEQGLQELANSYNQERVS